MKKSFIISLAACLAIFQFGFTADQELLKPEDLFDLNIEEFLNIEVISASKKSERLFTAPATVYVITAEEINRMGFQHLQDVLKYIPSVYLYNPHSWVWGGQRGLVSNFSQTLLLINGREVNNLIAQEGFISRQFATHNIDRIEVMASPGSALYGANALAGVINIITKEADPEYEGEELFFEAGSYNTTAVSFVFGRSFNDIKIRGSIRQFNSQEEDFSGFVKDSVNYSPGWADNIYANRYLTEYKNPSEAIPINLQVDYKGLYLGVNHYYNKQSQGLEKMRWNYTDSEDNRDYTLIYSGYEDDINESMRLKVEYQNVRSYMWGRYHSGFWPVSRLQSTDNFEIYTFPDQVITSDGDTLNSIVEIKGYYPSFAHYLIDQEILDPDSLTSSDFQKYFTHIYTNKNSRGSQRHRFDLFYTWDISDRNSLDLGYVYDNIDYVGLAVTDAGIGLGATYEIPIDLSKRDDVYSSYKHGFFAQLNSTILENRLWVNLGTRYDRQNHYGGTVNPRAGLIWSPMKNDIIKVMYGEAYREPNVFELSGDPDLEPAKLRSFEVNYSHIFGEIGRIDLTGYHNTVTNFLGSVGSLIGTGVGTVEKQVVNGMEFRLDLKKDAIIAFVNGALLFDITQELKNDATGVVEELDLFGIPEFKLNFGLSYLFSRYFTPSLIYSFIDSHQALSGNKSISEPFEITAAHDLKLTVQFGSISFGSRMIDGFLTINNLTDAENYQANIRRSGTHKFLQEGRNVMMRVRIH